MNNHVIISLFIFWFNLLIDTKAMFNSTGIPCKGQPEAHYSKFSFKQYFPFQHEHLTLDVTKIHKIFFFPNDKGVATNFHNGGDSSVEL